MNIPGGKLSATRLFFVTTRYMRGHGRFMKSVQLLIHRSRPATKVRRNDASLSAGTGLAAERRALQSCLQLPSQLPLHSARRSQRCSRIAVQHRKGAPGHLRRQPSRPLAGLATQPPAELALQKSVSDKGREVDSLCVTFVRDFLCLSHAKFYRCGSAQNPAARRSMPFSAC